MRVKRHVTLSQNTNLFSLHKLVPLIQCKFMEHSLILIVKNEIHETKEREGAFPPCLGSSSVTLFEFVNNLLIWGFAMRLGGFEFVIPSPPSIFQYSFRPQCLSLFTCHFLLLLLLYFFLRNHFLLFIFDDLQCFYNFENFVYKTCRKLSNKIHIEYT